MRHVIKFLTARACRVTGTTGLNSRVCSFSSSRVLAVSDLQNGQAGSRRFLSETHQNVAIDGIIRSPIADEDLSEQALSDYIFSRAKKFGSKVAMVCY